MTRVKKSKTWIVFLVKCFQLFILIQSNKKSGYAAGCSIMHKILDKYQQAAK